MFCDLLGEKISLNGINGSIKYSQKETKRSQSNQRFSVDVALVSTNVRLLPVEKINWIGWIDFFQMVVKPKGIQDQ